jgi:hypothetical protein
LYNRGPTYTKSMAHAKYRGVRCHTENINFTDYNIRTIGGMLAPYSSSPSPDSILQSSVPIPTIVPWEKHVIFGPWMPLGKREICMMLFFMPNGFLSPFHFPFQTLLPSSFRLSFQSQPHLHPVSHSHP